MRESMGLYRGKRIDNGERVEGYLFIIKRYSTDIDHYFILPTDTIYGYDDLLLMAWEVDPDTVGQYTGLTDKNGKKIFEGDIVAQSWYDHDEPIVDVFGEVVYCTNDCSFSVLNIEKEVMETLGHANAFVWEIEVLGNIHDHPELLKGGED